MCLPSGSRLVGRDGVHSGDFHLLGVSGNRLKIVVVNHDGGHAFVCWLEEVPYTVCRPSLEACPRPHALQEAEDRRCQAVKALTRGGLAGANRLHD